MRKPASLIAACFLVFLVTGSLENCARSRSQTSAAGLTRVVLQVDWYPQPEHGGFYTALAKGFYKEEGLDVVIQPGGPFVAGPQLVAAGSAQFGLSASDAILQAISDGQPLIAIAATMQHDPQVIMVRGNSPVKTFADLSGHTVAVKPGSTWFQYLVKRYRLTGVREIPATYSVANFVADPNYIQQAFRTSEPYFVERAGIEPRTLLVSDSGYSPYRVMFTSQSFLKDHPDVVRKFVQASLRGWREYLNDPAPAHALIGALNPALNAEWMKFSWQALRDGRFVAGDDPSGADLGAMTAERWNAMYEQLLDLKLIAKPFDPANAYTLEFVSPHQFKN
jgi:NitT/TauT family transport system substrate-binding protein